MSQHHVAIEGNFLSAPAAFDDIPEGLANALKVEIVLKTYVIREPGKEVEQAFEMIVVTHRALNDFAAVDKDTIDFNKLERDCELMKEALSNHRDKIS